MNNSNQLLTTKQELFIDDPLIPPETRIYYSQKEAVIWLAISIINLAGVIYAAFTDDNSYLALVIIWPVFSYVLFSSGKSLVNRRPQIILNANGIQSGKLPFYFWNEIKNEEVVIRIGKGPAYFLKYYNPSGVNELHLNVLAIDHRKLEKLLIIYRGRNNCKVS
ncbi:MAG: hypothetical protein ABIN91_08285 [Mucilaginibacter sp.]|uniref:hypothetical protein n=1 Tax=Mucilaginibacter sp. TaxID=1882438 RepID=UPI003267D85C